MKAIVSTECVPTSDPRAFVDATVEAPTQGAHDLLVAVQAVSVNPVDTKVRAARREVDDARRVLGWDAAGEVVAVGDAVRGFSPGDRVYYAGDVTRPGSNAERHAVDARIAAKMPTSLDFAAAAALPLTTLTAWEALFERMGISAEGDDAGKSLLIIGGAGGVGSVAIQLAKQLAKLRVIATASREASRAWCEAFGADAVIDHRAPVDEGLRGVTGDGQVDHVLCLNETDQHWDAMCRAVAPQGNIACIVDNRAPLDMAPLKRKSVRLSWELMFTRTMFGTPDLAAQGAILSRVARLIDAGTLRTTVTTRLSPICAATVRQAHAMIEDGHTVGKVVVADWDDPRA